MIFGRARAGIVAAEQPRMTKIDPKALQKVVGGGAFDHGVYLGSTGEHSLSDARGPVRKLGFLVGILAR